MQQLAKTDQRGLAHLGLIIIVVVVLGVIGFVGWRVMNTSNPLSNKIASKVANIAASQECLKEFNDKDLCKFLSSWNVNQKFKAESTTTADGTTSKSTMTIDNGNTYIKTEGQYGMEVITIGDTTYTKAGDTWYKQTTKKAEATDTPVSKDDFKFEEPKEDGSTKDPTSYEKQAKEACGKYTCFKYKVINPSNTDSTEYIWFDDSAYLIRKTLSEGKDGSKSESVFSYDNISVKAPSPVKELGANQYIIPGESEPQTLPDQPSEAEIQQMMQQYSTQ